MKHGVPLLLVAACAAVVVALIGPWISPYAGREAPRAEVWRYLGNVPVTRADSDAAAAEQEGITQCLWPRAVNGTAAGAARNEAMESSIGLAFCLRVPHAGGPEAMRGPSRPVYRT